MLQITDNAMRQFRKIAAGSKSKNEGIRIFVDGGGCSGPIYKIESSKTGKKDDKRIRKDGFTVYVEIGAFKFLSNAALDFKHTKGKSEFLINTTSPCPCG